MVPDFQVPYTLQLGIILASLKYADMNTFSGSQLSIVVLEKQVANCWVDLLLIVRAQIDNAGLSWTALAA